MPSHPFFSAVDPDTRARRVHEFVTNVSQWVADYRASHPDAPVDEAYRRKQFRRAANAEDEEARILRPTPGDVDPDSTIAAVVSRVKGDYCPILTGTCRQAQRKS